MMTTGGGVGRRLPPAAVASAALIYTFTFTGCAERRRGAGRGVNIAGVHSPPPPPRSHFPATAVVVTPAVETTSAERTRTPYGRIPFFSLPLRCVAFRRGARAVVTRVLSPLPTRAAAAAATVLCGSVSGARE